MTDSQDIRNKIGDLLDSGQPLTESEKLSLRKTLRNNPQLQEELEVDATVHALLLSLDDVLVTEDAFVQGVLEQCDSISDQALPVTESSNRKEAPLAIIKPSRTSRRRGTRHSTPRIYRFAIALSLLFIAGIGFYAFMTSNNNNNNQKKFTNNDNVKAQKALPKPSNKNNNNEPPAPPEQEPLILNQFATVTKMSNPVWENELNIGDRIGDETLRLFGGTAELTFDDGAVISVEGPVAFNPVSSGHVQVTHGSLSASVPQQAIGFKVVTPTSQIVDLGTEFDVSVKDNGATDVVIRKGEVVVSPNTLAGQVKKTWHLIPGELEKASFYERADSSASSPIAAVVQGPSNQFQGVISINGRSVDFTSSNTFNDVHQRVLSKFNTSRTEMFKQWDGFVDSVNGQSQIKGSVKVNGVEVGFGNIQDVMQLQNKMKQKLLEKQKTNSSTNIQSSSSFSGSININGQERIFTTREEYEAARREAFGPAATFGAGDLIPKD